MVTGWLQQADGWRFYHPSGARAHGWAQDAGSWYYLSPTTGIMATGWLKVGTTWYYLQQSGAMATGWFQDAGSWYYLNPTTGTMTTGWTSIGQYWFYLDRLAVLMITHDVTEAVTLADRVLVMAANPGHFVWQMALPVPPMQRDDAWVHNHTAAPAGPAGGARGVRPAAAADGAARRNLRTDVYGGPRSDCGRRHGNRPCSRRNRCRWRRPAGLSPDRCRLCRCPGHDRAARRVLSTGIPSPFS